jgi:hypothetical protein
MKLQQGGTKLYFLASLRVPKLGSEPGIFSLFSLALLLSYSVCPRYLIGWERYIYGEIT